MTLNAASPSTGFAPIVSIEAKVLILGSLPSRRSLEQQKYYAHPRNGFWPIMGALFDAGPERAYAQRVERLVMNRIAVWDVLRSSVREGSLDSAIVDSSSQPNDFKRFFDVYSNIDTIAFNGRKAEQMYRRQVTPAVPEPRGFLYLSLPSTSPAHAAMSLATKLQQWEAVKYAVMK